MRTFVEGVSFPNVVAGNDKIAPAGMAKAVRLFIFSGMISLFQPQLAARAFFLILKTDSGVRMRFSAFILFAVFTLQVFDAPPPAENPRTCCGRQICLCEHAKGAPCDFKKHKKNQEAVLHTDGGCPLHKGMSRAEMKTQAGQEIAGIIEKIKNASAVVSQAPCHTNTPKSSLPHTVRDYEPPVTLSALPAPMLRGLIRNISLSFVSNGSGRLERPPRLLFI